MLEKRSFTLAGHRTSIALEPEFWAVLVAIARGREETLLRVISVTDAERQPGENLASALRLLALRESQR